VVGGNRKKIVTWMNEKEDKVTQGDPTLIFELKHKFKEEVSLIHST